jgi:5-methylcytosine-specific restriction protein A
MLVDETVKKRRGRPKKPEDRELVNTRLPKLLLWRVDSTIDVLGMNRTAFIENLLEKNVVPYKPLKPCAHPGCAELLPEGNRFCLAHNPKRYKVADAIYSSAKHRHWSKMILARNPICCSCREAPSAHADHIMPLKQGGDYSLENGQGLCHPCHNRKTAQEKQTNA